MLTALGQCAHDRFSLTRRFQLAGRQLPANDRVRRRKVQISVAKRDAGAPGVAEQLLLIELAVTVGVAQRVDAARVGAILLDGDVDIAVGGGDEMPRGTEIVGRDERAEAVGQLESAVTGIARRRRRGATARRNRSREADRD